MLGSLLSIRWSQRQDPGSDRQRSLQKNSGASDEQPAVRDKRSFESSWKHRHRGRHPNTGHHQLWSSTLSSYAPLCHQGINQKRGIQTSVCHSICLSKHKPFVVI